MSEVAGIRLRSRTDAAAFPLSTRFQTVSELDLYPFARREGGARCEGKCIARDVTQDVNSL